MAVPTVVSAGSSSVELRLVDDRCRMCSAAAAAHPPLRVADAEVRRPLGAGVRGGHRDEGQPGRRRDRLAEVDRAAASEREHAVRARRRRGCLADPVRRDLAPARRRLDGQPEPVPARARHEQRRGDAGRGRRLGQRGKAPADDHVAASGRSRRGVLDERPRDARLGAPGRPYELDVPRRLESLDACHGQTSRREVALDRDPGDEGGSEAREHRRPGGLLQPELELDVQVAQPDTELTQVVLDHLPDPRSLLHEDERLGLQLLERQRPARAAVTGGNGEHDLVPVEGLERDAAVPAGRADDAELELPAADLLDDGVGVEDRERDAYLRDAGAGTRRARPGGRSRPGRSRRRSRAARPALPSPPRRAPAAAAPRARAAAARRGTARRPASVGSTRRPERSSSCRPSRCSSDRIWRLTAGCVTPSWSAAWEKLRRSTTAQKVASCFVSI